MDPKDIKPNDSGHEVPFRWWIWAVFLVVVLWLLSYLLITEYSGEGVTFLGDRGTFGDMFGAVNSLFSGLAFATLIYTVLQQRAELQATREEMKQQSREWVKQNEVLSRQAFEGSFFQMLNMLDDAARSAFVRHDRILGGGSDGKHEGDSAFQLIFQEFSEVLGFIQASVECQHLPHLTVVRDTVTEIMRKHEDGFFRYLDALANIAAFVVQSSPEGTKLYSRLMRSQMSNEQLCFVFYVCMSLDAHEDLRRNLDRLNFFESVPATLYIHPSHPEIYFDAEVKS